MQLNRHQRTMTTVGLALNLALLIGCLTQLALANQDQKQQVPSEPALGAPISARSTQPTIDRQLDTPSSAGTQAAVGSASVAAKSEAVAQASVPAKSSAEPAKPSKPKQSVSSFKKSSLAAQQNYDKYQLKATNSYNSLMATSPAASSVSPAPSSSGTGSSGKDLEQQKSGAKDSANESSLGSSLANKKAGSASGQQQKQKQSSFSLLRKFLPLFMTSAAGPMAAAAAAAAGVSDKHPAQHSRSSPAASEGIISKASGKFIQMLSSNGGVARKGSSLGAVPDHAPFFIRKQSGPIDRQAGFASNLLSNPLGLGLLFSAPLIPSLLLTPLAIAGLSPAMSALNNFFGDDDEASTPASSGPLASILASGSSPLSNFLSQASGGSGASGSDSTSSSPSFALQAMQSLLGPTSTTERPLFNPGLFASQGVQNAVGSLAGGSGALSSSGLAGGSTGGSGSSVASPIRGLFGSGSGSGSGGLMQAAASMISPSFAAPPSSGSSSAPAANSDDDGPGFMQVASDVFDKVASYMGSPSDNNKDLAQASSSPNANQMSPISSLVSLSSFSPFQISSLLASTPLAQALTASPSLSSGSSSSSSAAAATAASGSSSGGQKAGFFSTLRNVYELFSSSFLLRRNQEVGVGGGAGIGAAGADPNECQQRLICELHQRAMNSKLFRRSLSANLMELASLDRSLQEQMAANSQQQLSGAPSNSIQARVDSDTKQMLNDFLKATNNFRAGRELVNCSKMYPKCSRAQLLVAANAHLADPASSKAIGKFSNLMKKMKFKSMQQHQSQWKLRKPNKLNQAPAQPGARQQAATGLGSSLQFQPTDYLQVAPLSQPNFQGAKPQPGQLTPADSLKLVQQIMLMSQQQQQPAQPQQQQQVVAAPLGNQYLQAMQMQQPQPQPASVNQPQVQFREAPAQLQPMPAYQNYGSSYQQPQQPAQTTYTDAVVGPPAQPQPQPQANLYSSQSSTDSPYYYSQPPTSQLAAAANPQQQQQSAFQSQAAPAEMVSAPRPSQQQQPIAPSAYPSASSIAPLEADNKTPRQQQQQAGVRKAIAA